MDDTGNLIAAGTDAGGISPLFFIAGAVALIVVSTLGPLSRLHERRSAAKGEAAAVDVESGDSPPEILDQPRL